jgi:branched-chain amino acid transport system permease protein
MLGQQLANGLTMGSIYALIAIGVSMIYKSLGMLNVAHGDTIMLSAFIALTLFDSKIPLFIVLPLSIVITGFFGLFLERFIYRRLQYDSFTNLLIATIGMSIVLRNSSILIWGAEPRLFPSVFSTTPIEIAGLKILPQNIGIIMISLLLVAVLQIFFYRTMTGKQMRAAATDAEAAAMMGINVNRTRFLTFGISAALGAVAGVLLAPMSYASSNMGAMVVLKGFAAAILGGFGSISGAVVGGLLLGSIEAVGAGFISSAYRDVIAFLILFIVLYFKPTGLLAKRIEQKL